MFLKFFVLLDVLFYLLLFFYFFWQNITIGLSSLFVLREMSTSRHHFKFYSFLIK